MIIKINSIQGSKRGKKNIHLYKKMGAFIQLLTQTEVDYYCHGKDTHLGLCSTAVCMHLGLAKSSCLQSCYPSLPLTCPWAWLALAPGLL